MTHIRLFLHSLARQQYPDSDSLVDPDNSAEPELPDTTVREHAHECHYHAFHPEYRSAPARWVPPAKPIRELLKFSSPTP